MLARPRERGRKLLNIIFGGDAETASFPRPRSGLVPITIEADQSSFGATKRGPTPAAIAGSDLASWPGPLFSEKTQLQLQEYATQYVARAVADRNRTVVAVFGVALVPS